jgi:superfamily II RNA helicase
MAKRSKYRARESFQRRPRAKFHNKPSLQKIKPGADTKLKKVFAAIGKPDKKPFTPDPFQLEALSAIKQADCLVSAPTGAGKTWIAQQAIARIREKGGKSWYASPLKALSNAKYAEFSNIFGAENVGILTGDRKENAEAPVIVGTTEILRNQLYDAMHRGEALSTDFVILDEAHFLGDEDRGVVWEEIMIYLPSRIPLLLLSATIGNADQIAAWLSRIRTRQCIVVKETKRPVLLYPLFFHPSGTLLPLLSPGGSEVKNKLYKKVTSYVKSGRPTLMAPAGKLPPFGDILLGLRKYNLLPAIFFLKSRADCDHALDLCHENQLQDSRRQQRLCQRIKTLISQSPYIAKHRQRWHLEHLAVGAHHAGQLLGWKLVLETLMTEGLLDAVFATSTVAAGVNFPARTVVFFNSDKFNGVEFSPLTSTEFHQMTGRAGRRGMDHIGFAVAAPGKYMDLRLIAKLISTPASNVRSQIRINFSMVLNLLLSHSPDQIKDLLEKSFATYQMQNQRKKVAAPKQHRNNRRYLWRDFLRHLEFLKISGYVTKEGVLTDDGVWASQLRVDQPLMIAEGFRLGVMPVSDPALLAAIIASFAYEREADDNIDKTLLPGILLAVFLKAKKGLGVFAKNMAAGKFEVRPLFLRPAVAIYAWASGQPWERVLSVAEMEEGILAMLILRTADNLRHIRALRHDFPEAAQTAAAAIELILKDPVQIGW